jgi:hypothetical protein
LLIATANSAAYVSLINPRMRGSRQKYGWYSGVRRRDKGEQVVRTWKVKASYSGA